ncbi:hypothetical protein FQA39_LY14268 [Lamprigera yunnana]|nr:hypothetical protein FQA39_LY14268 [Lamprigera yunnana]
MNHHEFRQEHFDNTVMQHRFLFKQNPKSPSKTYRIVEQIYHRLSINETIRTVGFSNETVQEIIGLIRDDIQKPASKRSLQISLPLQVLATLRYLAKGAYQNDAGNLHGFSQATMSIVLYRVSCSIAQLMDQFIKFPEERELTNKKQEFYDIARIQILLEQLTAPGGEHPLLLYKLKTIFFVKYPMLLETNQFDGLFPLFSYVTNHEHLKSYLQKLELKVIHTFITRAWVAIEAEPLYPKFSNPSTLCSLEL